MSDVTSGKGFDSEFVTHPPIFFGRVVSKESWAGNIASEKFDNVSDIKGWGYRYKVRIFSWHTGDKDAVPDEQLVMANVCLPVTAGSGLGGSVTTPSIEPGSVVRGFFMDGMGGQEPYIDAILGNSNNNVPKEQGKQSTTDKATPQPPANLDSLSSEELNEYLNPARTPTTSEFQAASQAREAAKAAGLPPEEVERQVKIATIKAKQTAPANECGDDPKNLGYSLFNNTYSDSSKTSALVPDDRIVKDQPLSTCDAVHINTKASKDQDGDRKRPQEILSTCKKDDSETKGISTVISNLINDIEDAKKIAGNIENSTTQIQNLIQGAVPYIAGYIKSTMTYVRGYILNEVSKAITSNLDKVFPTQVSKVKDIQNTAIEEISCAFNKIIDGLATLIEEALTELINSVINSALCVAEQFVNDILTQVLDTINPIINAALEPLSAVLGAVSSITAQVDTALQYLGTLEQLFSCDEQPKCPSYDQIAIGTIAIPTLPAPPSGPGAPSCPTQPQECGAPTAAFFGDAVNTAVANVLVSPETSSIIGFDIINPGQYVSQPVVSIEDICGTGSGATAEAILNDQGEVVNVVVTNPGDGYLAAPDGSLGGNGRTWAKPYESYVLTKDGEYYVVPYGTTPSLNPGDTLYEPNRQPQTVITYPTILSIDTVYVKNPGFGYQDGDQLIITPNNGATLEPIIRNGKIEEVVVTNGGSGFTDLPEIKTNSSTGFNAQLVPVLKVTPIDIGASTAISGIAATSIVNVVDCVGKIPQTSKSSR